MIQYIIAAGLGALVGSAQRKGKKFAMGGTTGDAEERAFAEYMEDYGVDREEADEQFLGEFDNKEQWAAEFVDDTGGMESLIDPERFYRIDKHGFRQFALQEAYHRGRDIDEDNAEEYAEKYDLIIEYEDAVEKDELDDFIYTLTEEEEEAVLHNLVNTYTTADEIINDLGPNYGMSLDDLERAYLIMPDYDKVADALEDDGYVFIEKDFKTFVFNPNMARGGKTSSRERASLKKALKEMYDHLDKVRISLDDLGGVGRDNQGDFDWFDDSANVGSDKKFMFESEATEDFTKYLKKKYPAGKKMAHGGKTQGYEGKFKVDDLVYNKRTKTIGIVRMGDDRYGEVKTDADGNVNVDELEIYNPIKFKHQTKAKVAPSTEKEVSKRGLLNQFKNESVVTMDKGRRSMEKGGLAIHFDEDYSNKTEIEDLLMYKTYMRDNEYLTDYGDSFYVYSDDISPSGVRDLYESIIEAGYDENVELEFFGKGGKTQGYDDKLDESLGSRKGAERTKKQSRKDRRDESAAMEKSMGRRKYASVGTMDKGSREMEKGGRITAPQPILDGKEFIALVVDKDGMPQMKFSKTFNGALRMAKNMTKKFGTGAYEVKKFDPIYGASFFKAGLFIEPTKSFDKGGKTKKRKEVSDFDKLAMKVAARYRAEGKSNKEAMEIGRGTAANVARQQQAKKGKK